MYDLSLIKLINSRPWSGFGKGDGRFEGGYSFGPVSMVFNTKVQTSPHE